MELAALRRHLPNALSTFRLVASPVLLCLAWNGASRVFVSLLVIALLTDILDGKMARVWGTASDLGTKLDSWADHLMCWVLIVAAWWLHRDAVAQEPALEAAVLLSFAVPMVFGLLKYGRLTSYHTRNARLVAYVMGTGAVIFFAGGSFLPLRVGVIGLVLEQLEEMAITVVLPDWHSNVPSLRYALNLRREMRSADRQIRGRRSEIHSSPTVPSVID